MITPKQLKDLVNQCDNDYDIPKLEKEIDRQMVKYHGDYPWENVILTIELRNMVILYY